MIKKFFISKKLLLKIISIQIFIIILFSLIYYFIGNDNFILNYSNNNINSNINNKFNYFDYLYFSVVTSSTTGYGDIIPSTNLARILVTTQILLVYTTILRVFLLN